MATEGQQSENQKSDSQKSENHSEAPSPRGGGGVFGAIYRGAMRDGTLAALGREGIKDIQDTFHEAAWGQHSHGREPGAPLTPLHRDIAEAREQYRSPLPSPSHIAKGRNGAAADRDQTTVHGRMDAPQPTPGDIANGRDVSPQQQEGTVHGKGNAQYAQVEVLLSEQPPIPEPMPEAAPMPEPAPAPESTPAPEPAPAGQESATQGQAPRGSSFLDRIEAKRGFRGGTSDDGISHVEWLEQQRAQQGGGGGVQGQGRSVADEQKAQNEQDGPNRGGRGR